MQLVSELQRARHVAVATRGDVQVTFKRDGSRVLAYVVAETGGAKRQLALRSVPSDVHIDCKQKGVQFTPEGLANQDLVMEIAGEHQRFGLTVSAAMGSILLEQQ